MDGTAPVDLLEYFRSRAFFEVQVRAGERLVVHADTFVNPVRGIFVEPGAVLRFAPGENVHLICDGHIVVGGAFHMIAKDASIEHRLTFMQNPGEILGSPRSEIKECPINPPKMKPESRPEEIDIDAEAALMRFLDRAEDHFVPADRGLWVFGDGRLRLIGAKKLGWKTGKMTAAQALKHNWRATDDMVQAPTAKHDYTSFNSYDIGTPVVRGPHGKGAEVINLSRNVIIETQAPVSGAAPGPSQNAHVFINNYDSGGVTMLPAIKQEIKFALFLRLGFRGTGEDAVLGRYPVHFHHCRYRCRESVIRGVVVRESGHRAFVAHGSHRIKFVRCVAYDVLGSAYWWDAEPQCWRWTTLENGTRVQVPLNASGSLSTGSNQSFGISYKYCIAANIFLPRNGAGPGKGHMNLVEGAFVLGSGSSTDDMIDSEFLVSVQRPSDFPVGSLWRPSLADIAWRKNRCTNCVAAGIRLAPYNDPGNSADVFTKDRRGGFVWPESGSSIWIFQGCLTHNCEGQGADVWQNASSAHAIESFTAYRNGLAGFHMGAYGNSYQGRVVKLIENTVGLVEHVGGFGRLTVDGLPSSAHSWTNLEISGSDTSVLFREHNTLQKFPTYFVNSRFDGWIDVKDDFDLNPALPGSKNRFVTYAHFIDCVGASVEKVRGLKAARDRTRPEILVDAFSPDGERLYFFQDGVLVGQWNSGRELGPDDESIP